MKIPFSINILRRRISCKDLGHGDCEGWLWKKKDAKGYFTQKWRKYWFILKESCLYWYTNQNDEKAEGFISLPEFRIDRAIECRRKFAFKACHPKIKSFFFSFCHPIASFALIFCSISALFACPSFFSPFLHTSSLSLFCGSHFPCIRVHPSVNFCASLVTPLPTDRPVYLTHPLGPQSNFLHSYDQLPRSVSSMSLMRSTPSPLPPSMSASTSPIPPQMVSSTSPLPFQVNSSSPFPDEAHCVTPAVNLTLTGPLLGVSDLRELRVESRERRVSEGRERRVSEGREPEPSDGLEQLYRALEQANVTALGDPKPCSRQEFRRCFTQRVRDPLLNDRLHRVRALRSTLKAKESELAVICALLKDPGLCSETFREWKQWHGEVYSDICQLSPGTNGQDDLSPLAAPLMTHTHSFIETHV
uniref:PH domain-containing protein n=1 Tax=Cyclopterus lumpus TaxID=8103 RepID=A0A8C2ZT69_CYCLU